MKSFPNPGSHIKTPTAVPSVAARLSRAEPLRFSGKPYEKPGAPRGFTAGNHQPLLTPVRDDQRRVY